jgi:hypothetical protein
MFCTLAVAARRTGLGEFTILRAIEEGRLAGMKDLFGDWQVHEMDLRALGTAPEEKAGENPSENARTGAASNPDIDSPESLGPVGSDFDSQQLHLPCDAFPKTTQPVSRSTELVPSVIFLPGIAAKQEQCQLSEERSDGPRKPELHASAHSASICEDEIRLNDQDKISAGLRQEVRGFRKLPIRAILLLAIGWVGGLTSHHLFSAGLTVAKQNIASEKQIIASTVGQPSAAEKSGKRAVAPTSKAVAHHRRGMTSKPISPQDRETTGSIKQQDRAQQDRAITPFPDTRPSTVSGWTLRSVTDGIAVLEGPYGTWKAARGDLVPGLGKIDSIVLWGNRWIVATSRGLVTTP